MIETACLARRYLPFWTFGHWGLFRICGFGFRALPDIAVLLFDSRGLLLVGPDFSKAPLMPVIAQDAASGEVLMLAYMNEEAYRETLRTRRVCYFSRSRNRLWRKGEESGHVQELKELFYDCDADTLLAKVNQVGGAACHEGYKSCFFRRLNDDGTSCETVGERVFDPAAVYQKKT
jgi:phosphoribosyl-AMP cyclohydrolase